METTSPLHSQGLILQFSYSPSIPRDFPELASQTLLLRGLSPDVPAHAVIAPFMAQARQNLAGAPESEMPSIQAWRRGFARMGLKPTQYRCAAEALLRRLRKEGDLPGLHPLVDLCNAASVAFAIPVAVFDLDRISGCLQVRPATGGEVYETFSGEIEHPEPGEIIFADTAGRAHARRWCNRQSGHSAVGESTVNALIVIEALHATGKADTRQLVQALQAAAGRLWPEAVAHRRDPSQAALA